MGQPRTGEGGKLRHVKEEWLLKQKRLLNLLKRESRRYSDILRETGIPSSTLDRVLKEFGPEGLGILYKVDGRWAFIGDAAFHKQSPRTGSEYERLLEHSRLLVPGFEAILQELWQRHSENTLKVVAKEGGVIKKFAKQHLRSGYREIYDELEEYWRFLARAQNNLLKKYPRQMVRYAVYGIATLSKDTDPKKWPWSGRPPPKEIAEVLRQKQARYIKLDTEISNIPYHIRLGRSLRGKCDVCRGIGSKNENIALSTRYFDETEKSI